MYTPTNPTRSQINVDNSYIGETIEQKVNRILNNKEPIKDGAPLIYTERKDGVLSQYDPRTDRFELALEATDLMTKQHLTKRELKQGELTYDTMTPDQQTAFNQKFPNNKHNKSGNPSQ